MSTTVTYKGQTLTTADNETKVLETAGTWLEDDITIVDVSSGGGGTTRYIVLYDNSATITQDPDVNYIWINNQPETINVGDRYRITFNNTQYTCTAVNDSILGSQYGNTIGNPAILGGTDDGSNAPFCIFKSSWSDNEMIVSTSYPATTIDLKIEKIVQGGSAALGTKSIVSNGTYNASSDSLDGYSSVTVNVPSQQPQTQTKTATPSESSQTITPDSGYLLSQVTVNPIPSNYIVPSGTVNITQNGTVDVSQYASASVAVAGGSNVKTGSVTFNTTYNTTGNREITTTSAIGFTPKQFYLVIHNKSVVSGKQYAIIRASFETGADDSYYRTTTRYSNTSNSLSTSQAATSWTTQTNYYLYLNSGIIYIRTTNQFILNSGTTYDWIAIA